MSDQASGESRQVRALGVAGPGEAYLHAYDEGPLPDGQFRVETLHTGFSAGTELTFLKGSNPYLHARWDDTLSVFVPGEPGAHYPVPFLGYMEVGRVVASRTDVVGEGEIVAMAYGHKTGHTADPYHEFFTRLPSRFDPLLGIYVAQMGPICANGLLHAAADLMGRDAHDVGDGVRGRRVLVSGAGVVGLLTALFARRHGAEVAVSDPSPYRRGVAAALDLTAVTEADAWRWCKEHWAHGPQDRGADVAFQCRAHAASLHESLRALRPQGTLIDLAFYQGGAPDLRLGEEFHHNGLSLRCAQIGRVPRGLAFTWDRARLCRETVDLLLDQGDAIRRHLVTDIVPFDEAPALLADLCSRRRDFVQIAFQVAS